MAFNGTKVTFEFVGPKAKEAAETLWIQYLDGGLDQDIEGRLLDQGIETDYSHDPDTGVVTIKATEQEAGQ
jgi:hypothetical protein